MVTIIIDSGRRAGDGGGTNYLFLLKEKIFVIYFVMCYVVIQTPNIIKCTILPITSLLKMKKNKTGGTTVFIKKYIYYT